MEVNHTEFGSRYSRMDQVKFVEGVAFKKSEVIWSA